MEITNHLPEGSSFVIHCKSGDDDLGEHLIGPKGMYKFQFEPWLTTLFFCRVNWGRKTLIGDVFNTYLFGTGIGPCHHRIGEMVCKWSVTTDGMLEKPFQGKAILYNWDTK